MIFDIFFSITQAPSADGGGLTPQHDLWQAFFQQLQAADAAGFACAWLAEAHFSHMAQLHDADPVTPAFVGEIGLNTSFEQLVHICMSKTKQIGIGAAVFNLFANGGPIHGAESILQMLRLLYECGHTDREVHLGFAQGRFEYSNAALGIVPRNAAERCVWHLLHDHIFLEAAEIWLRLIKGEVLTDDSIRPLVLHRAEFHRNPAEWDSLLQIIQNDKDMYASTWGIEIITDFQIRFRSRFLPSGMHIGCITERLSEMARSLHLYIGSHNPFHQAVVNRFCDVRALNLSLTPVEMIESTHVHMDRVFNPSGGEWQRQYMPRTVLVFLCCDPSLDLVQQEETARRQMSRAMRAYASAMEGTVAPEFEATLVAPENCVCGNASQVADQLLRKFHRDERILCWFDFMAATHDYVTRSITDFATHVMPIVRSRIENTSGVLVNPARNISAVPASEILIVDLIPLEVAADVPEACWTSDSLTALGNVSTKVWRVCIDGVPHVSVVRKFDAVVFTGSPCSCLEDYDHTTALLQLLRDVATWKIPTLAICYAAQMLVRAMCGKSALVKLPEPHVGLCRIQTKSPDDELFAGMTSFVSVTAQSDAFVVKDSRLRLLASAEKWEYQAFRVLGCPVWGLQFHPNFPADGAEKVFSLIAPLNIIRQGSNNDATFSIFVNFVRISRWWKTHMQMDGEFSGKPEAISMPSYVARPSRLASSAVSKSRHLDQPQPHSFPSFSRISGVTQCRYVPPTVDVDTSGLPHLARLKGMAFCIPFSIVIRDANMLDEFSVRTVIESWVGVVNRIHTVMNEWNIESQICRCLRGEMSLNDCDPCLASCLSIAAESFLSSDGRFDPFFAPRVLALWKNALALNSAPSQSLLSALKVDIDSFREGVCNSNCKLACIGNSDSISLSCLSKGFSVDLLSETLVRDLKLRDFLIDFGGEIICGPSPMEPWITLISDVPPLPGGRRTRDAKRRRTNEVRPRFSKAFKIPAGSACATSGDFLEVTDAQPLHMHIMDMHQLRPRRLSETGTAQVTVCLRPVAGASAAVSLCAYADVLATTAMTFENPHDAATYLMRSRRHQLYEIVDFFVLSRSEVIQMEAMVSSLCADASKLLSWLPLPVVHATFENGMSLICSSCFMVSEGIYCWNMERDSSIVSKLRLGENDHSLGLYVLISELSSDANVEDAQQQFVFPNGNVVDFCDGMRVKLVLTTSCSIVGDHVLLFAKVVDNVVDVVDDSSLPLLYVDRQYGTLFGRYDDGQCIVDGQFRIHARLHDPSAERHYHELRYLGVCSSDDPVVCFLLPASIANVLRLGVVHSISAVRSDGITAALNIRCSIRKIVTDFGNMIDETGSAVVLADVHDIEFAGNAMDIACAWNGSTFVGSYATEVS